MKKMDKKTFKIFAESEEEFNVVRATQKNIEKICDVLTRCDFISAEETVHYAKIAGFEFEKNKEGKKELKVHKNLDKVTYYHAITPALFEEQPNYSDDLDRSEVTKAVDFFFASFQEATHTQMRFLNFYRSIQNLPILMTTLAQYKNFTEDSQTTLKVENP